MEGRFVTMNNWTDFRIKMIKFFRRNRKKILIGLIVWLVIVILNNILKNQPEKLPSPSTTYTPHVSVMDNTKEVPEKYQEPIQSLIDTYFNYCNNGNYEAAYNLITKECKEKNYPTIEQFKGYINEVFEGKKKIYNIQNYSIVDNKYIYNVRILDDILATGTTEGYYYYEEKFILIEEDGKIKLSIAEYIGDEQCNIVAEDDNMIIKVTNKSVDYESIIYTVTITNKTNNYIVVSDNTSANEILLDIGVDKRNVSNMNLAYLFVNPNSSTTCDLKFTKFYDENVVPRKIVFNNIRVLQNYDWKSGTTEENLNNAIKLYGLEINL